MSVTLPVGPAQAQVRFEVLNLLNRANVAELRLRYDPVRRTYVTVERRMLAFTPAFAARLSW